MSREHKGSDNVKHPPATSSTTPSQSATHEQTAPSRQERALRYLERKRLSQEAVLPEIPGDLDDESLLAEAEQITEKMPTTSAALSALKENTPIDLPSVSPAPASKLIMPDLPPAVSALAPSPIVLTPLPVG